MASLPLALLIASNFSSVSALSVAKSCNKWLWPLGIMGAVSMKEGVVSTKRGRVSTFAYPDFSLIWQASAQRVRITEVLLYVRKSDVCLNTRPYGTPYMSLCKIQ